jgi:hypothetical protein
MLIFARASASNNWVWLNTEVIQNSGNRVNTLKLIPYLNQNDVFVPGRNTQIGIQFIADPVSNSTLPQAGDRITVQGSVGLDINPIAADSKKNDELESIRTQVAALELAIEGRLINLPAATVLGRLSTAGTVETIPTSTFATPAQVEAAISALLGGATQSTLDTIGELAAALGDNPNFAATVAANLAAKVDKTSNQSIEGNITFTKPIRTPYLEKNIVVKITTGINWTANTWNIIPGLSVPFAAGEMRTYDLIVNYQYSDGASSPSHWQMGGSCRLPGGIGWKANGSAAEVIMFLQNHSGNDINTLTFRSAIGNTNRGVEVKASFNLIINGLGFIEFALQRFA